MPNDEDKLTKIHIDLPNHWATGGESLWALPLVDDLYELRNTPFHAYGLNWGDIVRARSDDPELKPEVREVVASSGNKTLRVFLNKELSHAVRFRVTPVVEGVDEARFSISWYKDHFHTISIRSVTDRGSHWHVHHSFNLGVSELIDDWLKQSARFGDVRWYTQEQWNGAGIGQDRPW